MLLQAALKALRQLPDPSFRRVLLRSLLLTLLLLVLFGGLAWWGLNALLSLEIAWLDIIVEVLLALGLVVGAVFLLFPVAALLIGLFLDDVAEKVEGRYYPEEPPGRELPLWNGILTAARFTVLVIGVNILLLPLYFLLPGINAAIFYLTNGYLLGREYFELVAYRHMSADMVQRLRRRYRPTLLFAGLIIAAPLSIPIVNLVVPLFATAFMVHVFKGIARRAAVPAGPRAESAARLCLPFLVALLAPATGHTPRPEDQTGTVLASYSQISMIGQTGQSGRRARQI